MRSILPPRPPVQVRKYAAVVGSPGVTPRAPAADTFRPVGREERTLPGPDTAQGHRSRRRAGRPIPSTGPCEQSHATTTDAQGISRGPDEPAFRPGGCGGHDRTVLPGS